MIRRKTHYLQIFIANSQTKNISREMSPFLFNFNFLNNKKIYQKQTKNQKKIKKKVVPAITDICTGGQQCKYQLLSSRGEFFVIVLKKYEGMQISFSN